eukprot:jgi/Orpsp1_1/1183029/evm.model.c7180000083578.1
MDKNEVKQKDITNSKITGFYLNEANNNTVFIKNNGNYWNNDEIIHHCNITSTQNGSICSTFNADIIYNQGDYCYSEEKKQIYLLTDVATFENNKENCIYGTDKNVKYIMSYATNEILAGNKVNNRLIKLTNKSITLASQGIYILDKNGKNIEKDTINISNIENSEEISIYRCTAIECYKADANSIEQFLSSTGKIYKYNQEFNRLIKINNEGIYFFQEDGLPCISENDVISQAIRISNNGKKVINEKIELKDLEDDVYVNEFNLNTVILYNGKKWVIQIANCYYDSETDSCINDYIEFSINGYFKSKSLKYIREKGYYVFDKNSHKAIQYDDEITTETSLVYCDYNGNCQEKTPNLGSYINKSSSPWNVVNYNFETDNKSVEINNNICQVAEDQTCHSMNGKELNIGDICMDSNSSALYLFTDGNECVKAEKTVIFYQNINNRIILRKVLKVTCVHMKDSVIHSIKQRLVIFQIIHQKMIKYLILLFMIQIKIQN